MPVRLHETRVGEVVSDRMQKTVVVAVKVTLRHPLYGKPIRRTRKYKAHDEENRCRIGDTVRIAPCRPLSKEKRWRVVEILARKGEVAVVRPAEEAEVTAAKAAPTPPPAEAEETGEEPSAGDQEVAR